MLIGSDFDKIQFHLFGLDLAEPVGFLGDVLISSFAFYFAFKVYKLYRTPFTKNWTVFFVIFGIGFIMGGFGHLFYNYLGTPGKYIGWFAGLVYIYFIEQAMLSFLESERLKKNLLLLSKVKLGLVIIAQVYIISTVNLHPDYSFGMKVPTINSTIGLVYCLGVLGYVFSKKTHPSFANFYYSVLIMFPAVFFQLMKINISPWFDKNDASHIVVFAGMFFYFKGIKEVSNYQKKLANNSK